MTTLIVLFFFFAGLIISAWVACFSLLRIRERNVYLENLVEDFRSSMNDNSAKYFFRKCNDGYVEVYRVSIHHGCSFKTTIKMFCDEDEEFNLSEAQYLVDKLNE